MTFILTKPRGGTVGTSIRLERTMLERLNKLAEKRGLTKSEIIQQAIEYALRNLDADKPDQEVS